QVRKDTSQRALQKGLCHSSYVALCAWSCRSLLVRTRCAFNSVRFEPVRWLRIAYPAGELLPGWLSAEGAGAVRATPSARADGASEKFLREVPPRSFMGSSLLGVFWEGLELSGRFWPLA